MSLRIDSHQHFWSLSRADYGWLTADLEPLYRDFGPTDLAPLLSQAGIDKTILIQAAATIAETNFLLSIADQHDFVGGVVGWVDMESSKTAPELLDDLAQHPKFVGIRPMIQDIKDPAWINGKGLSVTVESLIEHNLCIDALVKSIHIPHLLRFLERNPNLKAIIDHGAKPNIAAGEWQPWAKGMSAIAERTSAYCKVSGLITEASSSQSYEDVKPYLDHLLEAFGPERLLWGSDWPVLNLASTYADWLSFTEQFFDSLSNADRSLIMGRNATDFYGLE